MGGQHKGDLFLAVAGSGEARPARTACELLFPVCLRRHTAISMGASQPVCAETHPDKPRMAVHIRLSQQLKEALLQASAHGLQATMRFGSNSQPNVRPTTSPSYRHLLTLTSMCDHNTAQEPKQRRAWTPRDFCIM